MAMKVKLFDIRWTSHTAGPSPYGNNDRTELFLMGCNKAASGYPCRNCFNPDLWNIQDDVTGYDPKEMAEHIDKFAPNKFITIVGGEPLDQIGALTELCKCLKSKGFHIILFTHYLLCGILMNIKDNYEYYEDLLHNIDILIDGEYKEEERIYDEGKPDGLHNAVGSGNQMIWDLHEWRKQNFEGPIQGFAARDLEEISVTKDGELHYLTKEELQFTETEVPA